MAANRSKGHYNLRLAADDPIQYASRSTLHRRKKRALDQSGSVDDDHVQDPLNVTTVDLDGPPYICYSPSESNDSDEDESAGHDTPNEQSDEDCGVPETSEQATDWTSMLAPYLAVLTRLSFLMMAS